MSQRPVRFDAIGSVGRLKCRPASTWRYSASIGAIIAVWKACDVCSRDARRRRAATSASRRSIAATSRATTVAPGVFTAAISTPSGNGPSICAPTCTASIAPGAIACISRPRAATARAASSSDNTPARQIAAYFADAVAE